MSNPYDSGKALIEGPQATPTVGSRPITVSPYPTSTTPGGGVLFVIELDGPTNQDRTVMITVSPAGSLVGAPGSIVVKNGFSSASFQATVIASFQGSSIVVTAATAESSCAGALAVMATADM